MTARTRPAVPAKDHRLTTRVGHAVTLTTHLAVTRTARRANTTTDTSKEDTHAADQDEDVTPKRMVRRRRLDRQKGLNLGDKGGQTWGLKQKETRHR